MRPLLVIGVAMALLLTGVAPAGASQSSPATARVTAAARPAIGPRPLASGLGMAYNAFGLQKEVFGFAPYWALAQHNSWDFKVMSTVAYFGLSVNWDGNWINSDGGHAGFYSQDFTDMVNQAHAAGDRVVLVIKGTGQAAVNDVVTVPAETQLVITNTIGAIGLKGLDGVNVDFEGYTDATYPNIQAGYTNFVTQLSSAVHQQWPNAFVTADTYSGSASWDGGLMNIGAIAPVLDAMFIMSYDMAFDNMPGQAGPNAPLNGWTYNDTQSIKEYLTKAPASKIILGVPWYGYRYTTSNNGVFAASTGGAISSRYPDVMTALACAPGVSQNWDPISASPWAAWYSPRSGDPCGENLGAWQEIYYDNVQSLGQKYDLVNSTGIRGMGVWALGYDGGAPELWSELSTYFSCPVTINPPASPTTTEFTVPLSAGTCAVNYYDVEEYDATLNTGWYPLARVPGTTAFAVAEGFPGSTYQFRARAHSTAGRIGTWTTSGTTVAVAANATWSQPFKGLYTLDAYGGISADNSPPLSDSASWPGWRIAQAAHALPSPTPASGAVLDGYGGLHPYGTPMTLNLTASWPGWDIARDFAFLPDGSGGYVLDGFGGLHPFAVNGASLPVVPTLTASWPGWDIARKVVIFSDGTGGYVMDGFGGLHPFGINAPPPPAATGAAYWRGWTIARDVVLIPGTHAGYVLEGYGGLHPFSGAPALNSNASWPGWDIARSVWLLPSSTLTSQGGYVLDGYGGMHPFGTATPVTQSPYWPGQDLARNLTGF
jgi:spore germination protein YaaH